MKYISTEKNDPLVNEVRSLLEGTSSEMSNLKVNDTIVITAPGNKLDGKKARVFHIFDDGRVNAQIKDGTGKILANLTLKPGQFKESVTEESASPQDKAYDHYSGAGYEYEYTREEDDAFIMSRSDRGTESSHKISTVTIFPSGEAIVKKGDEEAPTYTVEEAVDQNNVITGDTIQITSPGNKYHLTTAKVFHTFLDGRINVKITDPRTKKVLHNLTLKPGQFKPYSNSVDESIDSKTLDSYTLETASNIGTAKAFAILKDEEEVGGLGVTETGKVFGTLNKKQLPDLTSFGGSTPLDKLKSFIISRVGQEWLNEDDAITEASVTKQVYGKYSAMASSMYSDFVAAESMEAAARIFNTSERNAIHIADTQALIDEYEDDKTIAIDRIDTQLNKLKKAIADVDSSVTEDFNNDSDDSHDSRTIKQINTGLHQVFDTTTALEKSSEDATQKKALHDVKMHLIAAMTAIGGIL